MKITRGQSIDEFRSAPIQIPHKVGESPTSSGSVTTTDESSKTPIHDRCRFTCKTCNKAFPSFQALGGHRTSHNKKKPPSPELRKRLVKPKMHNCLICGVEFSLGQSLGGHMRKHRALTTIKHESSSSTSLAWEAVPVINGRQVLGFDLNLMPSEEEM